MTKASPGYRIGQAMSAPGGGCRPSRKARLPNGCARGPDLAQHGVVRWRRADLAHEIQARFGVVLAERTISTLLHRLGFRRLVARPRHPGRDAAAQASFSRRSPPS